MIVPAVSWLHMSELHGAATHLAIVGIPLYAVLLLVRRLRPQAAGAARAEPWALGAAVLGIAATGLTGLLVRGEAQTELRGGANRLGTAHFWLGIALAALLLGLVAWRSRASRRGAAVHTIPVLAGGLLAIAAVLVQGYLGGRMAYDQAVGVDGGGQLAQSAAGAKRLEVALVRGASMVAAGDAAFSPTGLGCASCHGMRAQGARGPRLAGGKDLADFRRVHGGGLFPPAIVSDRDFAAVDAYLRTLARPEPGNR
jgi:uncharacterized membrane protein